MYHIYEKDLTSRYIYCYSRFMDIIDVIYGVFFDESLKAVQPGVDFSDEQRRVLLEKFKAQFTIMFQDDKFVLVAG